MGGLELLPLVAQFVPWIFNIFKGGSIASDKTLTTILEVVQKVFGTTDKAEIERQIALDRAKADQLIAAFDARRGELEAVLKDVQSARNQTVSLASFGSPLAWGAAIVSVLAVVGFFIVVGLFFFGRIPSGTDQTMLSMLVGAMTTGYVTVLTYWLGSSQGSRAKDIALANSAPTGALSSVLGEPVRLEVSRTAPARPVLRRE